MSCALPRVTYLAYASEHYIARCFQSLVSAMAEFDFFSQAMTHIRISIVVVKFLTVHDDLTIGIWWKDRHYKKCKTKKKPSGVAARQDTK